MQNIRKIKQTYCQGKGLDSEQGLKFWLKKLKKTGQFTDTWFLNDKISCTLKVQATPGSQLAEKMKQKIGSQCGPDGGQTKIVEMGGPLMTAGMGKSDPSKMGGAHLKKNVQYQNLKTVLMQELCTNLTVMTVWKSQKTTAQSLFM